MKNKKLKYFKLNLNSSDKVAQFRAYFKRLNSVKFSMFFLRENKREGG